MPPTPPAVPQLADLDDWANQPLVMPTEDSQERMLRYLDAAKIAASSDFPGLVLLSLCFRVSDQIWEECLQEALLTLVNGNEPKKAGNA